MSRSAAVWPCLLLYTLFLVFIGLSGVHGRRLSEIVLDHLPAYPCGSEPAVLIGKGAKFIINGTTSIVVPEIAPGVYDENNKAAMFLQNLTEVARGIGALSCAPDNQILQTLDISQCACSMSPYLRQDPSDTPLWSDRGVQLNYSGCPGHSNLTVLYTLAISDSTHTEFYDNLRAGSTIDNFTYTYPVGALKASLSIQNWTWIAPNTQESFLAMGFLMLGHTEAGGNTVYTSDEYAYHFNLTLGTSELLIGFERGLLFDGVPSVIGSPGPGWEMPLDATPSPNYWVGTVNFQPFCTSFGYPFQQWSSIYYDPTILSLFDPNAFSAPESGSPKAKAQRAAYVVPVAVAVSIVGAILITVILLAIFVPAVRAFFRPFANRTDKDIARTTTERTTWERASIPAI